MANNLAFSLSSICNQRARQQLYAPKPVRLELISPYTGAFSKAQLDMRRKAEILKYNRSSTKTNNPTKAQKWAQIVNGSGQQSAFTRLVNYVEDTSGNFNQVITNVSNYTCPNDDLILTPSYASNIPGPITYLYRDVKVPLYNLATNIDSYAITQRENTEPWTVSIQNNVFVPSNVETELFALNIRSYIPSSTTTFSVNMPIAIYIQSKSILDIKSSGIAFTKNKIQITDPILIRVYYNGQLVPTSSNASITPSAPDYSFDISCNPIAQSFNLLAYAGILTIKNLKLYTMAGYIYDIKIVVPVNFSPSDKNGFSAYFPSYTFGVYCNLSIQNYTSLQQVVIRNNPLPLYSTFTINGTGS